MRTKYATTALVLGRAPLSEASALITLLTPDLGLVRARAQGLRKPGAKLAAALATFAESDVILLRGKEGWRVAGAVLIESWFAQLPTTARSRAGRVAGLLLRLVHGEENDPQLYETMRGLLLALPGLSDEDADAAECLAALRLLHALGVDAGVVPEGESPYAPAVLADVAAHRPEIVARINRGISASGL